MAGLFGFPSINIDVDADLFKKVERSRQEGLARAKKKKRKKPKKDTFMRSQSPEARSGALLFPRKTSKPISIDPDPYNVKARLKREKALAKQEAETRRLYSRSESYVGDNFDK